MDGARLAIKASAKQAGIEGVSGTASAWTAKSLSNAVLPCRVTERRRWTDSQMPAHYTRNQATGKGTVARLARR